MIVAAYIVYINIQLKAHTQLAELSQYINMCEQILGSSNGKHHCVPCKTALYDSVVHV